jgi:hypothetical protein
VIQVRERHLPEGALDALREFQAEVDTHPTYAERVKAANDLFKRRNVSGNATFAEVRQTLDRMSPGHARCMYCEDSLADEIEHIRPKSLYPDEVFSWPNYVRSCSPCNRAKSNTFAIFDAHGEFVDVTRRRRGEDVRPPCFGSSVLLDPRSCDVTRFIAMDIVDTFYFYALAEPGSVACRRAEYTIDLLRLNDRDALIRQRRQAFKLYIANVETYRNARDRGANQSEMLERRNELRRMGHPTVWFEMRRQHGRVPGLRELFAAVPEALTWESSASASQQWPYESEP